jgi:hypothetical protein
VTSAASLDRVLQVFEQQRRTAAELRLLVALVDHEMTVAELTERMGGWSLEDVTEIARRLATAGLVRTASPTSGERRPWRSRARD